MHFYRGAKAQRFFLGLKTLRVVNVYLNGNVCASTKFAKEGVVALTLGQCAGEL
jgi:hypothetical protein